MKKVAFLFLLLICGTASGETFYSSSVTTFASPDNSYPAIASFIDSAETALYTNVYTIDSPSVALELLGAHERGVDVIVLVDGSPVGGISDNEWRVLNNLSGSGISVYLWDDADLGFNHAKYVVADNSSVLLSTENLGTTGFPLPGKSGNRGWGAIVDGPTATYFAELFFDDLETGELVDYKGDSPLDFYSGEKEYEKKFEPANFAGNFTIVPVRAPENAVESILGLINSAEESLYIEEFYIYKYWGSKKRGYVDNPFLEAAIDAARRGVEVKILLDSTWYNVEEDDPLSNRHTMQYANSIARDEDLDLEARLIDLDSTGFKKLHTKGVVADNAVFISSVNWNEHSPTKNREAGVIIYGEPAGYFADVFMADWSPRETYVEVHDKDYDNSILFIPLALAAAVLFLKKRK